MKWVFLFILIIPSFAFSQIDTCETYKELYSTAKSLNIKYKEKISKFDGIILDQGSIISIKNNIIIEKNFMLRKRLLCS